MCQPMNSGLHTCWDFDSETIRFTPPQNRPVALNLWSIHFSNEEDLIAKLRTSTLQSDRRKMIITVLIGFVCIAILCLKQWVAFTLFVFTKSSTQLSLNKVANVATGKDNSMNWEEAIYRRKLSLSLKCGNVSAGDFKRQPLTYRKNWKKKLLTSLQHSRTL